MKYKQSVYKTFALISQLGISILVPILLCTFFGTWLEKKVSFPVFIPLVIVGVLAVHGYLRDMRMKIRKTKTKIEQGGMKQHE
mgnify:CR=1 FL=1